jgi:hypothetical protein
MKDFGREALTRDFPAFFMNKSPSAGTIYIQPLHLRGYKFLGIVRGHFYNAKITRSAGISDN